jgi:predicted porin
MIQRSLALISLALFSISAIAQSNVTVFGTVDLYAGLARSGSSTVRKLEEGGQAASKLAFRGTEDLGGGFDAHFWLESGFSGDTGNGTLPGPGLAFTRQAYVGLKTPFGNVDLGRQYMPMFNAISRASPFGVNVVFSTLNLVAVVDAQPGATVYNSRANNTIRLRTPASNNWFADVSASAGEGTGTKVLSGAAGYQGQTLYVGVGVQTMTPFHGLSGSYDLRWVKLGAHVAVAAVDAPATPTAKVTTLSAQLPLGLSQFTVEASRRDVGGSPRSQFAATLGYDYLLSKRTTLYARVLNLENRGTASASLAQVPVLANSGNGVRVTAAGVRHNF